MTKHLVFTCAHSHPDHNNDRFAWLGNLIADEKPDVVIDLGDSNDLPSLCSYDKGTRGFEGRRYKRDIDHGLDAHEKLNTPIKARKKKMPKKFRLEGNHEYRIKRAIDLNPVNLEGIISPNDLGHSDYGWEYIEYDGSSPGVLEVDGICYAHFFTSGILGRPIGGEHPAFQMLTKQFHSAVQGHVHTYDYCLRTDATNKHIQALVNGCMIDYFADWAGNANYLWWRGCSILDNVENGNFNLKQISLEQLRKTYE